MWTKRYVLLIALALLSIVFAPFAFGGLIPHLLYGKRIAGQVVDAESGRPIEGAHVAFLWRSGIIPSGFTGHNSRDICYHAAATTTDVNGKFEVPAWKEWSTYDVVLVGPTVLVYKPGFTPIQLLTQRDSERGPVEHLDERYALSRFRGNATERVNSLFFGLANQACDFGGQSQKSLYPMLKAIYMEARSIALPGQRPALHSFALLAADAALAADPLGPSNSKQVEAFIRENLN
jgi:hypothetical protein